MNEQKPTTTKPEEVWIGDVPIHKLGKRHLRGIVTQMKLERTFFLKRVQDRISADPDIKLSEFGRVTVLPRIMQILSDELFPLYYIENKSK